MHEKNEDYCARILKSYIISNEIQLILPNMIQWHRFMIVGLIDLLRRKQASIEK